MRAFRVSEELYFAQVLQLLKIRLFKRIKYALNLLSTPFFHLAILENVFSFKPKLMFSNYSPGFSNYSFFTGVEVPSKDSVPKKRPIYEDKKKKKQQQPENKEGVVCI